MRYRSWTILGNYLIPSWPTISVYHRQLPETIIKKLFILKFFDFSRWIFNDRSFFLLKSGWARFYLKGLSRKIRVINIRVEDFAKKSSITQWNRFFGKNTFAISFVYEQWNFFLIGVLVIMKRGGDFYWDSFFFLSFLFLLKKSKKKISVFTS